MGEQAKIIEIIGDYQDFLLEQWNSFYPAED